MYNFVGGSWASSCTAQLIRKGENPINEMLNFLAHHSHTASSASLFLMVKNECILFEIKNSRDENKKIANEVVSTKEKS